MDYLWTPWRYRYVSTEAGEAAKKNECVFCAILNSEADDQKNLIVHRADHNFVILNRFPYSSGHAMVIPYEHLGSLASAPEDTAQEMMALVQQLELALRELYKPDGINIGMNIGAAAGAGVAGHIHMHVLPRWVADTNFASVIAETRVIPEELDVTWQRLSSQFAD